MADSLKERITSAMKEAMKSKDKDRLGAIRLIQAAIKQKEVDAFLDQIGVSREQMLEHVYKQLEEDPNKEQILRNIDMFRKKRRVKPTLVTPSH